MGSQSFWPCKGAGEPTKPSSGVLAFLPHHVDWFGRKKEKEPKNPTSLVGHFCAYSWPRDSMPPEKGEDLNLHSWHRFPHPPERAQCPRGRMLHSSAMRHRRDITAQITSQCSATDVSFSLQLWLEFGNLLWKYQKASQSKRTAIYKVKQSSSSPMKFPSASSKRCPCSHQSLCTTSQRPKCLFFLPAVNPSDLYNTTWFLLPSSASMLRLRPLWNRRCPCL